MSSIIQKTSQNTVFFVISSFAYLPNAEVALGQVKIHHPDAEMVLFITERDLGQYACPIDKVKVVSIFDIGIPDIDRMAFSYNILEFNTAVKPFCFLYLMLSIDSESIFYIDSDIYIVSPLEEVLTLFRFGSAQIVLTPHTLSPIEDTDFPSDIHFLQSGVFNLGFLAVRNGEDSLRFVAWWARKTRYFCKIDVKKGVFTDQKWCDLAPCLFSGVHILRHPGYNVAYWNLMHRVITRDAKGILLSGGAPLRFFHFSKLSMEYGSILCSIQSRILVDNLSHEAQDVIKSYRTSLIAANASERSRIPSDYGAISYIGDEYLIDGLKNIYDKYVDNAQISFALFLADCVTSNYAVSSLGINWPGCTDIIMACYDVRPDLQHAFPTTQEGMHTLLHWASLHFLENYNIEGSIKTNVVRYLQLAKCFIYSQPFDHKSLSPLIQNILENTKNEDLEKFWRVLKGFASNFSPVTIDESHSIELPELFLIIWEERPDLRSAFDIHQEVGAQGFIEWLHNRLQEEYGHSAWLSDLLATMFTYPFDWSSKFDRSLAEKRNVINSDHNLVSKMKEIEHYDYVAKENYSVSSMR